MVFPLVLRPPRPTKYYPPPDDNDLDIDGDNDDDNFENTDN